jgi:hypothetical protein
LEKWFSFESLQYRAFQVLRLENVEKSPSLDEIIDMWMLSPWRNELPSDALHKELAASESDFSSLSGNSVEKWCSFFSKEYFPNLLKIVQYVMSIPVSNSSVERVFSVMGNVWTDECSRLSTASVKSELEIFFNIPYSCVAFKDAISGNKQILRAAELNNKYKFKKTEK